DVILVDDVLTSGATTDACVRTLLAAGSRQVRIACFARVLDEIDETAQGLHSELPENATPETIGSRAPRDETV
ncbi:MAG: phosphoribosyltransferase family protein, partial [Acidiferrobacterales bacterium]|nr:phosphoribosyltransferase family protein [Acidiferrobacterales bacterium]